MVQGFVFALIEQIEQIEQSDQIIKIGKSPLSNPEEWLSVYPKDSYYIWVRHTPNPVCDERLLLETMQIWFKNRKDIGAKYFEGDHSVVTWLLSSLMLARETMQSR